MPPRCGKFSQTRSPSRRGSSGRDHAPAGGGYSPPSAWTSQRQPRRAEPTSEAMTGGRPVSRKSRGLRTSPMHSPEAGRRGRGSDRRRRRSPTVEIGAKRRGHVRLAVHCAAKNVIRMPAASDRGLRRGQVDRARSRMNLVGAANGRNERVEECRARRAVLRRTARARLRLLIERAAPRQSLRYVEFAAHGVAHYSGAPKCP